MKRMLLFAAVWLATVAAWADTAQRPMLEQGKTWWYEYHHFEDNGSGYDETVYPVAYTLKEETVIDGRTYWKMYRRKEYESRESYYAAYREEDGKVYVRYDGQAEDRLMIDFSLQGYEEPWLVNFVPTEDNIKVFGQLFRRYSYHLNAPDGILRDAAIVGVEGVGFKKYGLVSYVFEPEVDCICDYQVLARVEANGWMFQDTDFNAPKQIELTDEERVLVDSNNDFALRLFRKARGNESMVLSPLSITFALGMVNNAAAGQTLQEINQTLGFGDAGADAINQFCHKLLVESNTLDKDTKALLANTIYSNQDYPLQASFVEKVQQYYDATPETRNFHDGETMDVINQWASDHTEGMIPKMLNEDSFNPNAVSYLLNAIYFKGAWKSKFNPDYTREESFNGGEAVPMMHQEGDFTYADHDDYQSLVLPYGNGAYRMTVFLPHEDKTVGDVLHQLDGQHWQPRGHSCEVDLKLPRFETNTDTGDSLILIMSELGMPSAFIRGVAEFPYLCNWPDIYIAMMKQVAKIKLDEEGTEAAAVTIIGMETAGIPEVKEFHATRPFLYIISEQSTGAILFIGQYMGSGNPDSITPPRQSLPTVTPVFSLQGTRLNTPPAHGVYIQNGRKVVR